MKLRSWWWHRQGLDGSLEGCSAAEVLERSGWARSVGGVGPYLTLFARAGLTRECVDQALANIEIHELPAARSCTYVVPASDFALALRVGQAVEDGDLRAALKLAVTEKEITKLCDGIVKALAKGALDPSQLRSATGDLSRNLGEEGKKKGLTTTLPLALSRLQAQGIIRRIPTDGRLDQQRYAYALWKPNPLASFSLSIDQAQRELAHKFFKWIGPATIKEYQGFSGLGVKASAAILEGIPLEPCEESSDRLLLAEDVAAFRKHTVPSKPQYALVSSLDALTALRRDVATFVDTTDQQREVCLDKKSSNLGALSDLPSHAIFDRGRLVGLWEFDPEAKKIAYRLFVPEDKAFKKVLERTERYVIDQLGDARSFSLDSPKSRQPRIKSLQS